MAGQPPFPVEDKQIGFRPPDENWRSYVSSLTVQGQAANAINLYLFDLRENHKLRSNERTRGFENGNVTETPAPRRLDCHYLITAWSPTIINPTTDPTVDDEYMKLHLLIYEAIAILINNAPLVPRQIYVPDPLPANFPESIADAELPTNILPVDGFTKLAEFWGTMGTNHRWLPAIYLIVTLPVVLDIQIAGPMVTTRITEYRHLGQLETVETWIQIGGHVLNTTNPLPDGSPSPAIGAWVRLEDSGGTPLQTTNTNDDGRFTFSKLKQGNYILRVRASGFAEWTETIEVPSISGNYDIMLT